MKPDRFNLHFVTPLGVVVNKAEAERIEQLELDTIRARARREGLEKLRELGESLTL
jgi:hypothetical protein